MKKHLFYVAAALLVTGSSISNVFAACMDDYRTCRTGCGADKDCVKNCGAEYTACAKKSQASK